MAEDQFAPQINFTWQQHNARMTSMHIQTGKIGDLCLTCHSIALDAVYCILRQEKQIQGCSMLI